MRQDLLVVNLEFDNRFIPLGIAPLSDQQLAYLEAHPDWWTHWTSAATNDFGEECLLMRECVEPSISLFQ